LLKVEEMDVAGLLDAPDESLGVQQLAVPRGERGEVGVALWRRAVGVHTGLDALDLAPDGFVQVWVGLGRPHAVVEPNSWTLWWDSADGVDEAVQNDERGGLGLSLGYDIPDGVVGEVGLDERVGGLHDDSASAVLDVDGLVRAVDLGAVGVKPWHPQDEVVALEGQRLELDVGLVVLGDEQREGLRLLVHGDEGPVRKSRGWALSELGGLAP
jgi:hypothetical protein